MGEDHSLDAEIAAFRRKVQAMREIGATKWGDIELGAAPVEPTEDEREATQRRPSAEALERARRDERRRIASAASGGPLRRLDGERSD